MKGMMQDYPLVVTSILDYAARYHAEQEVISRTVEGGTHRYTYADMHKRAQLCSLAFHKLGVRQVDLQDLRALQPTTTCACTSFFCCSLCREGSIVATLAWNTYRHMETWYVSGSLPQYHAPPPYLQSCAVQQHMREEFYGLVTIFIHLWSAVGMASWVLVQWLIH